MAADGSRGQFVYVDRPRRTVVVKTSAWPYADAAHDAHCRDLTYRTLPAIAASTAHTGRGRPTVNRKVIITCALTGAGDTVGKSEHVPVTPQQIAESGIAAARAGAAIVHVHVRDPRSGDGSREVALYREVVERIRDSGVDVVINTTAGMGGDLYLDPDDPSGLRRGHRPGQRHRAARARRRAAARTSARSTAAA